MTGGSNVAYQLRRVFGKTWETVQTDTFEYSQFHALRHLAMAIEGAGRPRQKIENPVRDYHKHLTNGNGKREIERRQRQAERQASKVAL